MRFRIKILAMLLLSVSLVTAHGTEEPSTLAGLPDPVTLLYYSSLISGLAIVSSLLYKPSKKEKKIAFLFIVVPISLATIYLAGHTVYLNLVSESGGPVHWHADYEVWVCSSKLDLTDPKGFDNKVGTAVFHEHNDDRIHAEGVLVKISDASLESYFDVIGGKLDENELAYPTNSGTVSAKNNELCNGKPAKLQAFVYKTAGRKYSQDKLMDFTHYVLSPHPQVPPGDCIIIEFGEEKNRTDKICETYRIAVEKGDLK